MRYQDSIGSNILAGSVRITDQLPSLPLIALLTVGHFSYPGLRFVWIAFVLPIDGSENAISLDVHYDSVSGFCRIDEPGTVPYIGVATSDVGQLDSNIISCEIE